MLHPAPGRRGVLLLGSLGDEAMNAYRPLVFLAEHFAQAGCPTLRLEYYGFGDSAGEDGEPDRFQRWLDAVADGVRWLRENCGVESVTLAGARIGAAIADARRLRDRGRRGTGPDCAGGQRTPFSARTGAGGAHQRGNLAGGTAHRRWQLVRGARLASGPCCRATRWIGWTSASCRPARHRMHWCWTRRTAHPCGRWSERLRRSGADVTHAPVAGLAEMLRDAHENKVPHDAFARAVAWHAALAGGTPDTAATPERPATAQCASAVLQLESGCERPVWFGPDNALLGVLCEPLYMQPDAPVVLIANTGANPALWQLPRGRHRRPLAGCPWHRVAAHGWYGHWRFTAAHRGTWAALFGAGRSGPAGRHRCAVGALRRTGGRAGHVLRRLPRLARRIRGPADSRSDAGEPAEVRLAGR